MTVSARRSKSVSGDRDGDGALLAGRVKEIGEWWLRAGRSAVGKI